MPYNYVTCKNVIGRRVVMLAHGVMYDVSHPLPRGGPLIGAELRGIPPLKLLSGTSWFEELGRGFHRRQT